MSNSNSGRLKAIVGGFGQRRSREETHSSYVFSGSDDLAAHQFVTARGSQVFALLEQVPALKHNPMASMDSNSNANH
jgi:hypothetical protein